MRQIIANATITILSTIVGAIIGAYSLYYLESNGKIDVINKKNEPTVQNPRLSDK